MLNASTHTKPSQPRQTAGSNPAALPQVRLSSTWGLKINFFCREAQVTQCTRQGDVRMSPASTPCAEKTRTRGKSVPKLSWLPKMENSVTSYVNKGWSWDPVIHMHERQTMGKEREGQFHTVRGLSHHLSALDTWWLWGVCLCLPVGGCTLNSGWKQKSLPGPPVNLSLPKTEPRNEQLQELSVFSGCPQCPCVTATHSVNGPRQSQVPWTWTEGQHQNKGRRP